MADFSGFGTGFGKRGPGAVFGGGGASEGYGVLWGRGVFYVTLAVLSAFAMSREVFTLGLYLLVVPALILAAIQWTFLVLPLIDWPLTAWRRTGRVEWVVVWLGLALVFPLVGPAALNVGQAARIAMDRATDVASPAAPLVVDRPMLVVGDCGQECYKMLTTGAVERLLHMALPNPSHQKDWSDGSIFGATLKYASTWCDEDRRFRVHAYRDHPGWCGVERQANDPDYGAVMVLEGFASSSGDKGRRRVEIWTCPDRCRLVTRQTEHVGRRFGLPLTVAYRGDGMYIDPEYRRIRFKAGDAEPQGLMAAALGLRFDGKGPKAGEHPGLARAEELAFHTEAAAKAAREAAERKAFLENQAREDAAKAAEVARERAALERARSQPKKACREITPKGTGTFGTVCEDL